MTLSNLLSTTDNLVGAKQFVEARPYLEELVARFVGSEQKENLESVYFYLAISYLVEYSNNQSQDALKSAIEWLQRMQKEFPQGKFAIKGYLYEADAYRGLQDFLSAATIYENLLKPPLEPMMNYEQRLEVLEKLTQALYLKREWERGLPYFELFFKETRNSDNQAMAAAALMEGNIKLGHFDKALEFLRFLVGESPARYNLQLNVAMIDAGDRLAKDGRYTEAMLMYRMVLTVEEITNWQKDRLADLETQLNRLRLTTQDRNNERGIELETDIFNIKQQIKALADLKSYTTDLKIRVARNYLLTNRDFESFFAYMNLINEFPESGNDPKMLESFIYAAFTGATKIGKPDAVVELGERYLNDASFVEYRSDVVIKLLEYYKDKGDILQFKDLAKKFVNENPESEYASSVIYLLGDAYIKRGEFDEMIAQFKEWDKEYPTSRELTPGLYYWIGLGLTIKGDYSPAWEYYNKLLLDYEGSTYAADALYRRGICSMGIEDYPGARRDFDQYVREYPNTSLRGEVEFFLGEVDSATGNIQSALKHYSQVEEYSDNIAFIQNAYFRMGALLEANGQYQEMARIFQQFLEKYSDRGEVTQAIYQLGRAYELNEEPHRMLEQYTSALVEYGDDPYTYGLDEILGDYPGRYYRNQDRINQNVELLRKLNTDKAFRELIAKDRMALFNYLGQRPLIEENIKRALYEQAFRDNLVKNQDEIQPWLAKYEALQEQFPAESPEETFSRLYKQAREDGLETLALRLQHSLAMLGQKVDANRIFTKDDFYAASPVTLVWVGQQVQQYDPNAARDAFQMVIEDHPQSENVFDALLAIGDLEMDAGNFDAAQAFYDQAISQYPQHERAVQAVMKQADALRKQRNFSAARDKYREIAGNRDWRGPAHAEALYKIGDSFTEEGSSDHALAAYQRVYIGYSAFIDWAAKAYLEAGKILESQGKKEEAKKAYDEFLAIEAFKTTEQFPEINQRRSALK